MSFEFDTAEHLKVGDSELTEILREVYVDGGFTDSELAEEIFKANAVRDRGAIFCVRNRESSELAGIVILVAPSSKASRLAKDGEVEMQLLGVRPKFRGQGLGKLLVAQAIAKARADCCSKMVLWTQRPWLRHITFTSLMDSYKLEVSRIMDESSWSTRSIYSLTKHKHWTKFRSAKPVIRCANISRFGSAKFGPCCDRYVCHSHW